MGPCRNNNTSVILVFLILLSCSPGYTPRPTGFPRIDFPEKGYHLYNPGGPYRFEIPDYAYVEEEPGRYNEPWWINIVIPSLNGKIHISYKALDANLYEYIEDSRALVYKHTIKSEGIEEFPFVNDEKSLYGIRYELKGNVASPVQFFVTDSSSHFIRGSLYFNAQPNRDSLNPVIDYVRKDILHLLETTSWNY